MQCVICNSSDIVKKKVREEVTSNHDIVLFTIEVLVCENCGERYYDKENMRLIEEMRHKIKMQYIPVKEIGKVLFAEVI